MTWSANNDVVETGLARLGSEARQAPRRGKPRLYEKF